MTKNIVFIIMLYFLTGCQIFENPTNELIKEETSLSQDLKILVFEKNGNATTNTSIHIILAKPDYKLRKYDVGNIFIFENFENLDIRRQNLIQIDWIKNDSLVINHPESIGIHNKEHNFENSVGKIQIVYRTYKT